MLRQKIGEGIGRRFKEILINEKVKVYVCEEALRKKSLGRENIEPDTLIVEYSF